MSDFRFERVTAGERTGCEAALLAEVFPATTKYSSEYLRWQDFENPSGDIVGYDAYDSDTIAAHYVVLPIRANLFGKPAKGVLSLNTATRPAYQGKGLFVKLASMTYELARQLGYEFVVGVANANSTPGFVRKLGFTLVAPLDVEMGIGTVCATLVREPDIEPVRSDDILRWRMRNPAGTYGVRDHHLFSATHTSLVRMQMSADAFETLSGPSRGARSPMTAWIGLRPGRRWSGFALPVPRFLRPSPLNYIFLDLTGAGRTISPQNTVVEAVDFDAY